MQSFSKLIQNYYILVFLKQKFVNKEQYQKHIIMKTNYKNCGIQFLEQKRFPTKEKGKYNTPTKNVVSISVEEFEDIKM